MDITKQYINHILRKQILEDRVELNELYQIVEEDLIIYEFGDLEISYFQNDISYINHNSENDLQIDDRVCLKVKITFKQGKMDIIIIDEL